jgi:hypothetical protein
LGKRESGHQWADPDQDDESDHRGKYAAHELYEAGADQIAHAFHVVHDARNQRARFVGIVVRNREPPDMLLHLAAHFCNQALRGLGKQLGQRERGDALQGRRPQHHEHERHEQTDMPLADNVINKIFGGIRKHQPG